ncbi:UNVERIFIED_CONTAM: hypothetical protein Sangu_2516300 [Sesamum angustifolium]|uniref:Uncharacterized protein n=1 Tax=Sesamum angustifolium TaxID=2727405 RepID=A0AAW2JJZ2_9LAMI
MYGGILSSSATSIPSVPKGSTTKAASFLLLSSRMDLTASRIDGRERTMTTEISVSTLTSGGRSSVLTAGRRR